LATTNPPIVSVTKTAKPDTQAIALKPHPDGKGRDGASRGSADEVPQRSHTDDFISAPHQPQNLPMSLPITLPERARMTLPRPIWHRRQTRSP